MNLFEVFVVPSLMAVGVGVGSSLVMGSIILVLVGWT